MRVRRAAREDAGKLALVGGASFLESFADDHPGDDVVTFCAKHHSHGAWETTLGSPEKAAWLAEAPVGAPIGYALVTPAGLPGTSSTDAELKRIYVLSRWHGTGVGRALFEAAEQEARDRGAVRLVLGVYKNNAQALRFYTSRGFEIVGETVFAEFDAAFADYVMAKPLQLS